MNALTQHRAIEIRIGNVGLVPKLDAIAAALTAIRDAHRDEMPVQCWAAINRARDQIAEAMMAASAGSFRLRGGMVDTEQPRAPEALPEGSSPSAAANT